MHKYLGKLLEKIKSFGNKKINLSTAIAGIAILAVLTLAPWGSLPASESIAPKVQPAPVSLAGIGFESSPKPVVSLASLESLDSYKGLPVSGVKAYPIAEAEGTAILIPQYHRDPTTSNVMDPANDSGVRNQKQTLDIVEYLAKEADISLIMVEGDLQGEVPQGKIDQLKKEIMARDQFADSVQDLKQELSENSLNPAMEQQLLGQLDQELEAVDRDVWLHSAPYVLKARGEDVTLVGSENQQTLDSAAKVIRDYVYLNDRMAQISQQSPVPQFGLGAQPMGNPMGNPMGGVNAQNIQQMLQRLMGMNGGGASVAQGLSALQSMAQQKGYDQLASVLAKTQQSYQNLQAGNKTAAKLTSTTSRANNPYANISDPGTLQNLLKTSEQKVNAVVIEQRNQEAAAGLAEVMKSRGQDVGIVQFGAGHEQGLVKALNQQKLNVIVITSQEVAARAGQQI